MRSLGLKRRGRCASLATRATPATHTVVRDLLTFAQCRQHLYGKVPLNLAPVLPTSRASCPLACVFSHAAREAGLRWSDLWRVTTTASVSLAGNRRRHCDTTCFSAARQDRLR